jgi:hypothetical protein
MWRIARVVLRPRSTMAALVAAPTFLSTWAIILLAWLACGWWLLSTPVGRQALVDERVRVVELFGGQVTDKEYADLRASPPLAAYVTSGGRLLLTPPVTVAVALGLALAARADHASLGLAGSMAVSVHASVALAVQQVVSTPLAYLRESLSSPTHLAALSGLDEGTFAARLLGAVDLFGLWWVWLLAVGLAAATGRPAWQYGLRLLAVYLGVAVLLAAAVAAVGGA